jgi:hypothetical protein
MNIFIEDRGNENPLSKKWRGGRGVRYYGVGVTEGV